MNNVNDIIKTIENRINSLKNDKNISYDKRNIIIAENVKFLTNCWRFEEIINRSVFLLRDLADLQNGAPLIQHEKQWEETMKDIYSFLNIHEPPFYKEKQPIIKNN